MITKNQTGDNDLIKQINLTLVLNLIREKGPISRIEVSKLSTLNRATVSSLVDELMAKKYILEVREGKSSGGRKPILVRFNSHAGYVLGLEINVDFIIATRVNLSAEIQWEKILPIASNEQAILEQLYVLLDEMITNTPASPLGIIGIGIGVAGVVNLKTGSVVITPNGTLKNVPLKHLIQSYTGINTFVDNDCNTAAMAESMFGAGTNRNQLILVSISHQGIGVGILLDGKIFRGSDGFAGEMGHMTINMDGPKCNCGNRGCWEVYASAKTLTEKYRQSVQSPTNVTVEKIIELANHGDPHAITSLTKTGEYLGVGLSNIVNTFNPDVIILRGAIASANQWIYNPIQRTLLDRAFFLSSTYVEIIPSQFGRYAAAIGAACSIIHNLLFNYDQKL
jgi:predicted NBD/HSP70 family sugar kinase